MEKLAKEEDAVEKKVTLPASDNDHRDLLPETVKEYLLLPAVQYTRMLSVRQLRHLGCDYSSVCPE